MSSRGQAQAKLDVADKEGLLQTERCECLHTYKQISRADSRAGLLSALHKAVLSLNLSCCFVQGPLERLAIIEVEGLGRGCRVGCGGLCHWRLPDASGHIFPHAALPDDL